MAMRRSRMTLWPQLGQHPANLAVLALVEHDLQPGAFALRFQPLDAAGADVAVAEPDALEQLLHVLAARLAGHLHLIRFLDAETRVHQPKGQVAIVGQQQQALAVLVEPADRVDALADVRHQIDGQRPAGRIVVGAEVAARLVDQPVDGLFAVQRLAIDAHFLRRVRPWCPARGRPAIDADAAADDEFSQCRREPTPACARNLLRRSIGDCSRRGGRSRGAGVTGRPCPC